MSASFDVRKDSPVQREAMGAYIAVVLESLLPPLRLAARGCGYAITVHGSLKRDIDLVAIPWVSNAQAPDKLLERLCGVIAGVLGRATILGDETDKPHGRKQFTIVTCGEAEIDLSVMPLVMAEKEPDA